MQECLKGVKSLEHALALVDPRLASFWRSGGPIFWAGDFGRQEVTSRLGSHCVVQENDLVQMEGWRGCWLLQRGMS